MDNNKKKILIFFTLIILFAFALYITFTLLSLKSNERVQNSDVIPSQALLEAPKYDGVYLVNHEIAMGKWMSQKDYSDACYWVRRKYDAIVRGEFYGSSGGVMEIVEGDYEVEMRGCGEWFYLGK